MCQIAGAGGSLANWVPGQEVFCVLGEELAGVGVGGGLEREQKEYLFQWEHCLSGLTT